MRSGCVLLILFLANIAQAGRPFIGFEVGAGDLDANDVEVSDDVDLNLSTNDTTAIWNLNGGYEFDSGLHIAAAIEKSERISFFGLDDNIEVDAYKLGVGYGGQASERFRVYGTVGANFWELEARESFFLNPGPETTGSVDGEDFYVDFGGEYLFNDALSLVFLFNYNNYDFGDATAVRVGVRFRFPDR